MCVGEAKLNVDKAFVKDRHTHTHSEVYDIHIRKSRSETMALEMLARGGRSIRRSWSKSSAYEAKCSPSHIEHGLATMVAIYNNAMSMYSLISKSISQTGFCEGVSGVPRDENSWWRKSFFASPKFVCTSVNKRPVLIMVFLGVILLKKIRFNKHGVYNFDFLI